MVKIRSYFHHLIRDRRGRVSFLLELKNCEDIRRKNAFWKKKFYICVLSVLSSCENCILCITNLNHFLFVFYSNILLLFVLCWKRITLNYLFIKLKLVIPKIKNLSIQFYFKLFTYLWIWKKFTNKEKNKIIINTLIETLKYLFIDQWKLDKYKIQKPAKNHRQINPQKITDTIFIYKRPLSLVRGSRWEKHIFMVKHYKLYVQYMQK